MLVAATKHGVSVLVLRLLHLPAMSALSCQSTEGCMYTGKWKQQAAGKHMSRAAEAGSLKPASTAVSFAAIAAPDGAGRAAVC